MNYEVLIMSDEKISAYPVLFINKQNKIILKKITIRKGDFKRGILKTISGMANFANKIDVTIKIDLSEEFKNSLLEIGNVHFKKELSKEMQLHIDNFYDEEKYIKIGYFHYEGLHFVNLQLKVENKMLQRLYFKRDGEDVNKFISRLLVTTQNSFKGKFEDIVYFNDESIMNNYMKFKWSKKYTLKKASLFSFDSQDYIKNNQLEIENRIKSEIYNQEQKEKYSVNYEDVKKYNHPVVIYTDGSVFPNGRSGIGVVFVENNEIINVFGKRIENDLSANGCESWGIYEALRHAEMHISFETDYIEIRADSLNCVRNIDEKNNDIDQTGKINELIEKMSSWVDIKIVWNKGHSGIYYNELVDEIARKVCL